MKKLSFLLITFIFSISKAQVSIPTGTWRFHFSFDVLNYVEYFNGQMYASSRNALMTAHVQSGDLKVFSKLDGIHGSSITAMATNEDLIMFGFADGTIQIIDKFNTISTIKGFERSNITNEKFIYHISLYQKIAYISTAVGILVVNLELNEIIDNYLNIGPNGILQFVSATDYVNDTLYAATPKGVIYAVDKNNANLSDFNNWKTLIAFNNVKQIANFNQTIYFATDTNFYKFVNGKGTKISTKNYPTPKLKRYKNKLLVIREDEGFIIEENQSISPLNLNIVKDVAFSPDEHLWYSNGKYNGLIRNNPQFGEWIYKPSGPKTNSVFNMSKQGPLVYATGGGVNPTFGQAFNDAGFYVSDNGVWNNNVRNNFTDSLYDFTFTKYEPKEDCYYVATHINGIVKLKGTVPINRYSYFNSTLQNMQSTAFTPVSGMALDNNGVLWLTNFNAPKPLHAKVGNTWVSFNAPAGKQQIRNIEVDQFNRKWMLVHRGGLVVFDDNNTPTNPLDDRSLAITSSSYPGLIADDVRSLAIDKNNWIWIGTSAGLSVITNASNPFENLIVEQLTVRDVDGEPTYLLGENQINDICIDGGNRKWFATNDGAVLVEPDGQTQVQKLTIDNSPLPSNQIITIGQSSTTGEIYFGTRNGIVSYQSDAASASEKFNKIKVYPNPIPPNYSGVITIDGLAENSEVRITDANGMLISLLKANGSKATWNGLRLNGTKPNSGVFYVFAINSNGTETEMGKFIYIY